tara:strand:+ start:200 stop:463 length:264 start_codon:yes stop_codon:yes gene_type:complete
MIFRSLLISAASALLSTVALGNASQEMKEGDFLDLVDASGHVTVQGNGVADVNANAKAQGLSSPALGNGLLKDIASLCLHQAPAMAC